MRNKLKAKLAGGGAIRNGWLSVPSGYSAEVMGRLGWDSLTVDLQHGVQDYQSLVQCFQALSGSAAVPLARVPDNSPGIIGKVLDAGAWGVICPLVNSVAEAEAFAAACLYPPHGARSFGPNRAGAYGDHDPYHRFANDEILVIAMIETAQALDNVEAIAAVPGISGLYVGPSDLGFSLGLGPAFDRNEPEILAAYAKITKAAEAAGKFAGLHCLDGGYAAKMITAGFRFVTIGADALFITQGAKAALAACPDHG